jgi:hypothetical protein
MKQNKTPFLLNIKVIDLENYLKLDEIYLLPDKDYVLVIRYPLSKAYEKTISSGKGMRIGGILNEIHLGYKHIYEEAEKENPYGVWGHGIRDLWLETIQIDHEKLTIGLGMGS